MELFRRYVLRGLLRRPEELLTIDESTLLGKGGSKDVYIDPRDESRCIKIVGQSKFLCASP